MLSYFILLPLLATECLAATTQRVATPKKPQGDGPTGSTPPCDSYESCERPGLLNWNILQTTLMDPNARDRTDGLQIFQTWYAVQLARMPNFVSPMLQRDLTNHGFDVRLLHSWETTARYKANGAPDPFAAAYCESIISRHSFHPLLSQCAEWGPRSQTEITCSLTSPVGGQANPCTKHI